MSTSLWTEPNLGDYILLAGQKSPGLAEVSGASSDFSYKIQSPPFATGARMIFMKRELSKFTVKLSLYTLEELQELETWRKVIDTPPKSRNTSGGLSISHPQLDALGITACVVESVSQLEPIDDGGWAITIKFIEWRGLPKQTLAKVEAAKDKPLTPREKEIMEKTETVAGLWEGLAP